MFLVKTRLLKESKSECETLFEQISAASHLLEIETENPEEELVHIELIENLRERNVFICYIFESLLKLLSEREVSI